jgi:subtilase family serine protease
VCLGADSRLGIFVALTAAAGLPASAATGQLIANNTPKFAATAKNLGPENPSKIIDVGLWLNLPNRAALDSLVEELYDPASSHYREWLKPAGFAEKFAPTAQEARSVGEFLSLHNLRVVAVGPNNMFVRARVRLPMSRKRSAFKSTGPSPTWFPSALQAMSRRPSRN